MSTPPPLDEGPADALIAAERMRVANEVCGIGVWELEPLTGATRWDARTRAILGAPPDGDVDQAMFVRCLHPEDREGVLAAIASAHDPAVGEYDAEYRVVVSNRERWVRAKGRAFFGPDGTAIRFIGIVLDVSEEKARQQELRRLTEEVERKNEAKDQFIATLGHELRNPLSPIVLGLALLREKGQNDPIIDTIERHVRHVGRLVDDLLDVSRVAHGKVRLQRRATRLQEVVGEAIESVAAGVRSRKQRVNVTGQHEPAEVYVDHERLKQVIANLVHNASKFSPMSSVIDVEHRLEGELISITVADRGVGIEPSQAARLFEPFAQRPQALARQHGGLGLGLAVVKGLVELHGGEVVATSDGLGHGTTVRVTLPRGKSRGTSETARAAESAAMLSPTRVLVVDDNEDLCQMMVLLLEGRGSTVQSVHDGHAALRAVAEFKPAIVLIDIGLPGLDGYEVARRIHREHERPPALVAITGYGQARDRDLAAEAGFDRHLVKPVELHAVFAAIEDLVSAR